MKLRNGFLIHLECMGDHRDTVLCSDVSQGDKIRLGPHGTDKNGWTVVINKQGESAGMDGTIVTSGMDISLRAANGMRPFCAICLIVFSWSQFKLFHSDAQVSTCTTTVAPVFRLGSSIRNTVG